MLADYVKTTCICTTLPQIPTPPLIMAVNIGEAVGFPLPSKPPWVAVLGDSVTPWALGTIFVKRNGPPIFINISVGGSVFSLLSRYFLSNDSIHWSNISTIKYVQVTSFDLRITYLEPPEG